MLDDYLAHTPAKGSSNWHGLQEHTEAVANLAAEFGIPLSMVDACRLVGLLHDIGKAQPAFQQYLKDCAHGFKGHGANHKTMGAFLASLYDKTGVSSLIIQGHHSGLQNKVDTANAVREVSKSDQAAPSQSLVSSDYQKVISAGANQVTAFATTNAADRHSIEFMTRMIFSCLVDADGLDTEAHFDPKQAGMRSKVPADFELLWSAFSQNQDQLMANANRNDVFDVRKQVYDECVEAASQRTGVYSLTVPTGCGKTRSSMAFALNHAIAHGHKHIIYAIPYTSIVEQTVDVFRSIFGKGETVLEHHSATRGEESMWQRLSAENWDAPITVTTTVQLFESLFSSKPSQCRKNHRLAESVIILDEVQSLPVHLLKPTLNMLTALVTHTKATVVLCTATQPAIVGDNPYMVGLPEAIEIVSEPVSLFQKMKRVDYQIDMDPITWIDLADNIAQHDQCLVIVNSKRDAKALYDALNTVDKWHLSTDMCGAHRRKCLEEVKQRLKNGQPCVLVSTQVIEAGVDIDFPTVYRAIGPLDSIVQAAGRCNREGKSSNGNVYIFDPDDGHTPSGSYKTATGHAKGFLSQPGHDMHNPKQLTAYFGRYYQDVNLDSKNIQNMRKSFNFADVNNEYRLIDEYNALVITHYDEYKAYELINTLHAIGHPTRDLMRELQPLTVQIRMTNIKNLLKEGIVQKLIADEDIYEWLGSYDPKLGILPVINQMSTVI
ncbi:MAG: CRISPR-associated helicase Cas3' [Armatimonadota bacterium]